nr:hypothetical protein [Micromonospora haikouensis]
MIERGSGRTSGLTDWRLMDLLSMWACVQDHDTAGHWKQVAGWRKVCDLAQAHLGRLKEYRRGLAEAWPPATNAAARAYLGELDDLIDKVQRTHDAAAANYDALAAATRAISSARAELKPLHDEYVEKLQQKRTYEATAADPKAAMGARVPDKPVTDADLERLNVQARNLMYGLSGELQQAQVMLRQPPTPHRPGRQPNNPDTYESTGIPPVIPPVLPVSIPTTSRPILPSGQQTGTSTASVPSAPHTGPILGGIGNGPATSSANSTSLGATPPLTSSPPGVSATPPPNFPPAIGNSGRGGITGSTPGQPRPTPPTRSPFPSGLIGGTPGLGTNQPSSNSSSRRVNPIGGVIGGGGAGTSPTGAAGTRPSAGRGPHFNMTHAAPPIGAPPGVVNTSGLKGTSPHLPLQETDEADALHWDPDHPWATAEGVPPVVRPSEKDGPIDPGPAIGFDR